MIRNALYHIHHQSFQEDLLFWLDLTKEGDSVLELGCGTGRVTIPLGEADRKVWGLDHDPEMLDMARFELRKRPQAVQARIHFLLMDMTSFHLAQTFDVVLSPCNTYSLFAREKRMAILNCVVDHLQEGSTFAVSVPNPDHLLEIMEMGEEEGGKDIILEDIFTHPQTGDPIQVSSQVTPTEAGVKWTWFYDRLKPDGEVERETVSRHHLYSPFEQYNSEFKERGFSTRVYGDFNRSPFNAESPYLIMVGEMKDKR